MNLQLILRTLKKSSLNFSHHNGFLAAKALAFQSLFCLLPTFLLMFFLSSYYGIFQDPLSKLEKFISSNFVPAMFRSQFLHHINVAFEHAQSIFALVLTVFIITSFSLLSDLYDAFYQLSTKNQRKKVKFSTQILIYIFIIILSLVLFITDFIFGAIFFGNYHQDLPTGLFKILSFIATCFAISVLYFIMSPMRLQKRKVLLVSFFVGLVLFLGQKLFLLYLTWFPGYMLIYGAIAVLPILFFWVYLHWLIVLFGYSILVEYSNLANLQIKMEQKTAVVEIISTLKNVSTSKKHQEDN